MIAIIFLCVMKSHLFAMFVRNFTTTSLSIAEILLFIKRWSKIAVSNIAYCLLTPCRYWRQRLRNFCINKNKMVISREDRMLIKVLRQEKGYGSKKLLAEFPNKAWSQTSLKRLLRKVDASGSIDRKHGSGRKRTARTAANIAYSYASLRECWWRTLWTSVVTATATEIYRLNWYQRCSSLVSVQTKLRWCHRLR